MWSMCKLAITAILAGVSVLSCRFLSVVSPAPAKLQGSAAVGSSLPSWPPAVKIDPDYDKLKKSKRFMMYTWCTYDVHMEDSRDNGLKWFTLYMSLIAGGRQVKSETASTPLCCGLPPTGSSLFEESFAPLLQVFRSHVICPVWPLITRTIQNLKSPAMFCYQMLPVIRTNFVCLRVKTVHHGTPGALVLPTASNEKWCHDAMTCNNQVPRQCHAMSMSPSKICTGQMHINALKHLYFLFPVFWGLLIKWTGTVG